MHYRPFTLTRISPFSAFKLAMALSLIALVAWLIAVVILYIGMDVVGIWESANSLLSDVSGQGGITFGMVMAFALLIGVIMAVLFSVLAPLFAVIYNGIAQLFGGLELEVLS